MRQEETQFDLGLGRVAAAEEHALERVHVASVLFGGFQSRSLIGCGRSCVPNAETVLKLCSRLRLICSYTRTNK